MPLGSTSLAPTITRLAVRTPTLPPATHTNMYAVGTREAVLVEPASPFPDEIDRAVAWAEQQQRAGFQFLAVLATHHHGDHIGGAAQLRQRLGLPLWAHGRTAERAPDVTVDRLLDEGDVIELDGPTPTTLTCILTPGHAPGHLCFLDRASQMLLAGDMVASVGSIIVEPRDGDMALYLESLGRMRELQAMALLPAHGELIPDATGKLDEYVAHRLAREAKVLAALRARAMPSTPVDLVPSAYAEAHPSVWPLAALSTEAHLIKLETDGLVARHNGAWVSLAREPP